VLGRLAGWVPHNDRRPGKIGLTRGLRRLMEMLTTEAILVGYLKEHGDFNPKIAALLGDGNRRKSYNWISGTVLDNHATVCVLPALAWNGGPNSREDALMILAAIDLDFL